MTNKEAEERFGDIPLMFSGYYKYVFTFTGRRGDIEIEARLGGAAEEIYRLDIDPNKPRFIDAIQSEWNCVTVMEDGKEIFGYTDW